MPALNYAAYMTNPWEQFNANLANYVNFVSNVPRLQTQILQTENLEREMQRQRAMEEELSKIMSLPEQDRNKAILELVAKYEPVKYLQVQSETAKQQLAHQEKLMNLGLNTFKELKDTVDRGLVSANEANKVWDEFLRSYGMPNFLNVRFNDDGSVNMSVPIIEGTAYLKVGDKLMPAQPGFYQNIKFIDYAQDGKPVFQSGSKTEWKEIKKDKPTEFEVYYEGLSKKGVPSEKIVERYKLLGKTETAEKPKPFLLKNDEGRIIAVNEKDLKAVQKALDAGFKPYQKETPKNMWDMLMEEKLKGRISKNEVKQREPLPGKDFDFKYNPATKSVIIYNPQTGQVIGNARVTPQGTFFYKGWEYQISEFK